MTDTSAPAHNKNQRWECKDCGMINSAAMTVCQSCGSLKFYGKVIDETERKPTENEWKCPTCGRINQNYVGTCGCGTPKP